MLKLFILNTILILIIVFACIIIKKKIKSEKGKYIILLIAAFLTILCHYSSIIYHLIKDGTAMNFLKSNPNLILPIYPCNVVMWCCLILGIIKDKTTKFSSFLIDYIFMFGIISCLVGLFANVDFIRNQTLKDYDVTKGILAHGFMLFNVMLLPFLGFVKIDLPKNMLHIVISIILMLFIGLYCNLMFSVLDSSEAAYNVNSMFLLHSPFDDSKLLTYPFISAIALVMYFIIFNICELIIYKKDNIYYKRIRNK